MRSRAEPCRAMPRSSLRCCVVLHGVLSLEHRAVPGIIRVVVYYLSSVFLFYMYVFDLLRPSVFSPKKIFPVPPIRA